MAKLTVKTAVLQRMLNKVMKGVSNIKVIPITSLMEITLENNALSMTSFDGCNFIKVIEHKILGEEFAITIEADTFNKLIQKTTCENVTLTLTDDYLQVEANGKYKLPIPLDDEEPIRYPDIPEVQNKCGTIQYSDIAKIIESNKPAIANTMEIPCLTGYYCSEGGVYTTNQRKIALNGVQLFEEPVLIGGEVFDMLTIMSGHSVSVFKSGDEMLFWSKSARKEGEKESAETKQECIVYTVALEEIDSFPADSIDELFNSIHESSCTVSKADILSVLDRISLFISNDEKNGVYITFTKDGIKFQTRQSTGIETVNYATSKNAGAKSGEFKPYTCCMDIQMFKDMLSCQPDGFELHYGHPQTLKFTHGKVQQAVAVLEDDRVANG